MSQDTQVQATATEVAKTKVSVNAIKTRLINGVTRADIAKEFGMSKAELNRMMKHPKLAGLRPKKASGFLLVDEDEDGSEQVLDYPKAQPKAKKEETEAPAAEETVSESTGI